MNADVKEETVERAPGLSVRVKLTLSYVCFLMVAGVLMLAAVWVVLLRYIPDGVIAHLHPSWWIFADRSDPLNGFGATAAFVLAILLIFGLVGGWLLAGRMLAPLTRITVSGLRKRLGEPWIIATLPGVGYRIDTQPDAGHQGGARG